MEDIEYFLRLKKYLKVMHHTKGRIRLDVNLGIKKEKDLIERDFDLDIKGINEVKINKILGKITINYDKDIVSCDDVTTLFSSEDMTVLSDLFEKYKNC